jgi:hypothetical protein
MCPVDQRAERHPSKIDKDGLESIVTGRSRSWSMKRCRLTTPHSPEWKALNDEMIMMSGGMTVPKNVHTIR